MIYRLILIATLFLFFVYFSYNNISQGLYFNLAIIALVFGLPIYGLLRKRYWAIIYTWIGIILLMPLLILSIAFSEAVGFKVAFQSFAIIFSILAFLSFLNYKSSLALKI